MHLSYFQPVLLSCWWNDTVHAQGLNDPSVAMADGGHGDTQLVLGPASLQFDA
jgi:hypothetical protein